MALLFAGRLFAVKKDLRSKGHISATYEKLRMTESRVRMHGVACGKKVQRRRVKFCGEAWKKRRVGRVGEGVVSHGKHGIVCDRDGNKSVRTVDHGT
ncbi:unnamed protein product [Dovyalis caffra]|uniref:Uncharacterized protein n=1 Tax=Dovyalis caffra TaxID=77055 RepID=A0AAV1RCJ4_9ROSI|nr:unnamed protein product [Dovyalis caffra]